MIITELSVSTWLSRFFKLHNESSSLNSAHMHLHTSTSPFKEFPLKSHKDLINIITDASRANLSLSIMEFLLIPTMPTCGILIFFHLFLVVIIGWRKHQVILAPQQRKYAFPHRNPLDRGPPRLGQWPHPVDRQTPVKTLPSQTSSASGKNAKVLFLLTSRKGNFGWPCRWQWVVLFVDVSGQCRVAVCFPH